MRKRLAQSLILLSLLLCLATIALWIRSYFASDGISRHAQFVYPDHQVMQHFSIQSLRGRVFLRFTIETTTSQDGEPAAPFWEFGSGPPSNPPPLYINHLGFEESYTTDRFGPLDQLQGGSLMFPHIALAILFSLAPAFSMLRLKRHYMRQNRGKHRLCLTCNYDLRAHTPGGICPECGTPIPRPKSIPQTPQPPSRNPQESSP